MGVWPVYTFIANSENFIDLGFSAIVNFGFGVTEQVAICEGWTMLGQVQLSWFKIIIIMIKAALKGHYRRGGERPLGNWEK